MSHQFVLRERAPCQLRGMLAPSPRQHWLATVHSEWRLLGGHARRARGSPHRLDLQGCAEILQSSLLSSDRSAPVAPLAVVIQKPDGSLSTYSLWEAPTAAVSGPVSTGGVR